MKEREKRGRENACRRLADSARATFSYISSEKCRGVVPPRSIGLAFAFPSTLRVRNCLHPSSSFPPSSFSSIAASSGSLSFRGVYSSSSLLFHPSTRACRSAPLFLPSPRCPGFPAMFSLSSRSPICALLRLLLGRAAVVWCRRVAFLLWLAKCVDRA